MKSKFIRLLSLFMTAVMLATVFSTVSYAQESGNVVASGFCGAEYDDEVGQNLVWTYYDTKELVISGEGFMDWYLTAESGQKPQPWHDYLGEVEVITVEDGVTSIGSYAFRLEDDRLEQGRMHLKRVNIAGSVRNIYDNVFYDVPFAEIKPAVVFGGSEAEWQGISGLINSYVFGNWGSSENSWRIIRTYCYPSHPPEYKAVKMYYDGQEPQSFCTIITHRNYISEGDYTFSADYYAVSPDERLVWSLEGDGEIKSLTADKYGMENRVVISARDRGSFVLTLKLTDSEGRVISSDSESVTSAKIAPGDSAKTVGIKLRRMASNISATLQLSGVFGLMYTVLSIESVFLYVVKAIRGVFN